MIEPLELPASESDIHELAELLADSVESGAAVSFLSPLTIDEAAAWWRQTIQGLRSGAVVLVFRDDQGIAGTVQLHPAWAPNQPHRAEVTKLLVHRRARRKGVGRRLMKAVEEIAIRLDLRLLTLDAKRGSAADTLYRSLGWIEAGTIPRYALDSDGTPHDAVLFYRELNPEVSSSEQVAP